MKIPDTPLFVKTHDFNVWLLGRTRRFPKHFRYTLMQRLENLALEFEELLLMANVYRAGERRKLLQQADGVLLCLRMRLRYTLDFERFRSVPVMSLLGPKTSFASSQRRS